MLYNTDNQYFAAIPNRGAGIGHQLANWIAGYWFDQSDERIMTENNHDFEQIPPEERYHDDFLHFSLPVIIPL